MATQHGGRARARRADHSSHRSKKDDDRFLRLRGTADEKPPDRLILATLKIRTPLTIWTGPFTLRHPSLRLEILNRTDISKDVSVSDCWVGGGTPGSWARELAGFPDVVHVESLAEIGGGCLYRVTYQNPPVVYLYRRLGMPLQFPLRIEGGFITWELAARSSEFEEVVRHARSVDPNFRVISIRRRPLKSHLPTLTDAQQELLSGAMAAGYFAVPRGITLTDLARKLGRSKSGISEAIALIEKKVLEAALNPPSLLALGGAEASS